MGRRPIAGMHGYHPEDLHSRASFATTRADGPIPRRLDDIKDVILDGAGALAVR